MAYVVLCGLPEHHCTGGTIMVNAGMRASKRKGHRSHTEAYRCYRRYIVGVLEYEDIGSHSFRPPDGGPVLVLSRPGKFGARFMPGKEGRWMPRNRGGGEIVRT